MLCRAPKAPPRNLMDLYPKKGVESQVEPSGRTTLMLPRFQGPFWGRLFFFLFRGRPNILLHLDEVGSFVWEQVDGESSVFDLAEKAHAQFGDKVQPVHERVAAFIAMLTNAKAIELLEK